MTIQSLSASTAAVLQKAQREFAARQVGAAAATLAGLLAAEPDCAPALGLAGVVAQMQGQHARAVAWFRKAIAAQPGEARLYAGLGISLFEQGNAEAAVAALRRACELAPNVAAGWYNLGKALKLEVQVEAAIDALQRALALAPSMVPARLTLADSLASIGRVQEAVAEFRRVLAANPDQSHAWYELANLKVVPFREDDVAALRDLFEATGRPAEDRVLYGFTLARALEDQGDYQSAFRILKRANRLQREALAWNANAHHTYVDEIERAFTDSVSAATDSGLGGNVIFITSLPRSGSSLVEQILASHPEVEGANEIADLKAVIETESERRGQRYPHWIRRASPDDWHRLGQDYLARTARWRTRKPRFTDKALANWHFAGSALSMLPAARVVIVRRDPLENCLACYRQWFSRGTAFAYDLDELAAYCADFYRLTRFWLRHFPERVFDLEYEALLADPEGTIRRLLAFCGLAFDPVCLEFWRTERPVISAASAAQVRQPLQRGTARAARYGHALDGLRAQLTAAGLASA